MGTKKKPKRTEEIEEILKQDKLSDLDLEELEKLINLRKESICDNMAPHVHDIECYSFDNQRTKVLYRLILELKNVHFNMRQIESNLESNLRYLRGIR